MRNAHRSWFVGMGLAILLIAVLTVTFGGRRTLNTASASEKGKKKERREPLKEAENPKGTTPQPTPRSNASEEADDDEDDDDRNEALERTRTQVKMLDDLYKTAVVLITDKYVHSKDDFPAGSAAIALFAAMKKKGWHEVRLVDASGEPLMESNSPRDDFEKQAVEALKGGKDYFEEVVEAEGKSTLRAATPVPVVLEKCIICHPNYKDVAKGAPIGILSYSLQVK